MSENQRKKFRKTVVWIGSFVLLLGIVAAVIVLSTKRASARELAELLDLGEKYLSELNYEQAIVAYRNAIEINPKCVDAYIGLADAYIAAGEFDKAEEILAEAEMVLGNNVELIKTKKEEVAAARKQAEEERATPSQSPTPSPTNLSSDGSMSDVTASEELAGDNNSNLSSDSSMGNETTSGSSDLYGEHGGSGNGFVEKMAEDLTAFERLFSNGPIPAQDEGGLWGYIDITGSYVIEPSFLKAKPFLDNEMALVQDRESQLWGMIDMSGSYVVEPMFSDVGDSFCDNLLRVEVSEFGWGYINQFGEMVIEPQFMVAKDFSQGFARVSTQWGVTSPSGNQMGSQYRYWIYGYINTSGEKITEDIFSDAYDFSEGLALVKVGDYYYGNYGYINTFGELVIYCWYDEATSFSNGRAFVCRSGANWNYYDLIDKEGNILLETYSTGRESLSAYCGCGTGSHAYFVSGLRAVQLLDSTGYVYIDIDGNVVLPSVLGEYYGEAKQFRSGYALVQDAANSLYGYIDLEGNWVISPKYSSAGEFYGGYAVAVDHLDLVNGFGLIDMEGNWVIDPQYIFVRDFQNEMACVEKGPVWDADNRKAVVIDIVENFSWELDDYFSSVSLAAPDRLMVTEWNEDYSESIVSFRSRNGEIAIDATFEQSDGFSEDCSYAKVKYNGLWGIIGKDGNWLIPARFLAFE